MNGKERIWTEAEKEWKRTLEGDEVYELIPMSELLERLPPLDAEDVWKKKYGLAAVVGLASHLLLDLNGLVPWFYPFKDYNFYDEKFYIAGYIKHYLAFSQLGYEFIIAAVVGLVAITWRFLYK